jgi:hypothetical protein
MAHLPSLQTGLAPWNEHTFLQLPQFLTSMAVVTSQPSLYLPLQSALKVLHVMMAHTRCGNQQSEHPAPSPLCSANGTRRSF